MHYLLQSCRIFAYWLMQEVIFETREKSIPADANVRVLLVLSDKIPHTVGYR